MPQSSDSEYRNTLSLPDPGVLDSPIHCHPCAKKRSGLIRAKRIRNAKRVTRPGSHEIRKASVHRGAGDALRNAQVLGPFPAKLALSAGPMDPGDSDPLPDPCCFNLIPLLDHSADHLVAENQREFDDLRQLGPVSL